MSTKYIISAIAGILALNAHATSLDLRGQYKLGSEKYESRAALGYELESGLGGSVEYVLNNTSKAGEGLDQAHWDNTEFELYYKYKLNNTVTLLPSVIYQNTKDKGDYYKLGFRTNWAFAPSWRLDGRVRYEYKQRETKDFNKNWDNDSTTRTEVWLRKTVSAEVETYYNFRWDRKLAAFQYADKSKNYTEHNLGMSYKVNSTFKPYAEFGYLGEAFDKNKNLTDDWRIRVGTVINF